MDERTVMFSVEDYPLKHELIDALKYGNTERKFRIKIAVAKSGLRPQKVDQVQVLGYQIDYENGDIGWVELTLRIHESFSYHGRHPVKAGVVKCWINVKRRQIGTIHLVLDR